MRVRGPNVEPAATSAASLVPSARIQHPPKPAEICCWATLAALGIPLKVSWIDRAPETSMCVVLTPTLNSWEGARSRGLGTNSAEASPSDVESPMYTTERHDVCV